MACTFVVKDPKTGKEVDSLLYKDLVEHYGSENEAELAYRSVIDGPKFKADFGDFHKSKDNYLLRNDKGNPRLDKYGEPLAKDVIKYFADWKLSKLSHNAEEFNNVATPGLARLQKMVASLGRRLENLRRMSGTIHEQHKLRVQIGDLLRQIGEANEMRGFVNYTKNAIRDVNKVVDQIEESDKTGKPLTGQQMKNMFNITQAYSDVAKVLEEAQEWENSSDLGLGKSYFLPNVVIKNLKNLQETLDLIKNEYKKRSLDQVADAVMGGAYEANAKEFYRRSYAETPEGKRKKGETNTDYRKRVQKHVDLKMQANNGIIEQDAKEHTKRLLSVGVDITYLERWALNASNTTSEILRSLNFFILKAEDAARLKWTKFAQDGNLLFQEYKKHMKSLGKNENNLSEFFELIGERSYDKNGKLTKNGTGWVTHRWHSNWHKDLETIKKAMAALKKKADVNVLGQIDKNANARSKKIDRVHTALRKLYYGNKSYDEDAGIANLKERISTKYEGLRDLEKAILRKDSMIKRLQELPSPTTKEINQINKLEQEIYELTEKRADILSDAISLENTLRDELFNFEDIYHVPNIKRINQDKAELKRLLNSVGIPFDLHSTDTYLSEQYKELNKLKKSNPEGPVYKYYKKFILKGMKMRDSVRPEEFKTRFKYDAIRKLMWERFDDVMGSTKPLTGMWNNWTKNYLKEIFTYQRGKDIESGQQLKKTGEVTDSKLNYVPIFFTKELPIEDQQMHLHQNVLVGNFVSINYNEKNEILPYIEMLLNLVQNRKMIKTKGFQRVFDNLLGNITEKVGNVFKKQESKDSKTYANAMDLVAQRMFNETVEEAGITLKIPGTNFEISVRQLWNLWLSATSTVLLSANWMSTISNRLLGGTLHLSEALANEFFSVKSMAKGAAYYHMDDVNIVADIGRAFPRSKTNLLGLLFDPMNDFSMHNHTYAYNNKMKALLNSNTLHGLNNMAEHDMHHQVMYTVLAETKVLNKAGEYIHKSGKGVTKKREDAMDLAKAYSRKRLKDGIRAYDVFLDNKVAAIEYRLGESYFKAPLHGNMNPDMSLRAKQEEENIQTISRLTQIIQKINEMEHGAYSLRNAPPMRRQALGQGLETMRKFYPVGIKQRLQGIGGALLEMFTNFGEFARTRGNKAFYKDSKEGSRTSSRIYDPIINTIKEGVYVTALKFFSFSAYHGFKKLGQKFARLRDDTYQAKKGVLAMTREEWSNMSQNEKANVRRTFFELGLALFLMQAAHNLKKRGDDDDKRFDYMMAFFMARLSTELMAYANPWEAGRLLQSPATTTTFIERIWTLIDQLGEDIWAGEWERYKAGTRKGETKIRKALYDVVPWAKAINRHKYVKDILTYHYRD